jgi:hypothetical protein
MASFRILPSLFLGLPGEQNFFHETVNFKSRYKVNKRNKENKDNM